MSDDLNEFLRQAALRREARQRASGKSIPRNQPPTRRSQEPPIDLEIIEPLSVEDRHLTPKLPPPEHLSGNVAQVDQKREAHLQEAFGRRPAPLAKPQKKKGKAKGNQGTAAEQASAAPIPRLAESDTSILSDSGTVRTPPSVPFSPQELLAQLRDPNSLRMAFIASEIFGRKFQ